MVRTLRDSFKHALLRTDPGWLAIIAVCSLAVWPFLSRSSLPQNTDAELHVFRLAELSRLVRGGELYPRWAPNFFFGYGYPIFNYYAPLGYYLGLLVDLLPMLGPVAAVKAVFLGSILTGAAGMYGYVRVHWGRAAGLVAAAAYTYNPYVQYIDPHIRGDMAEAVSFAVFPLALWSLDRLRRRPGAAPWLLSIVLVAGLVTSHNLMAMVFVAMLTVWVVGQTLSADANAGHQSGSGFAEGGAYGHLTRWLLRLRLPLALGLGIGLAAFFWLVVALEMDAVKLTGLVGEGTHFDFRNHFVSLPELLSPPVLLDWGASQPQFFLGLGLIQWLAGAVGVVALITGKTPARGQGAFAAVSAVILTFLMTTASRPFWSALPLLQFLQFPWRLLGAAAAMTAILSGVAANWLARLLPKSTTPYASASVIGLIMIVALPLTQIPPWPRDFGPVSELGYLEQEMAGRWLGTTSTSEFLPATVDVPPGATSQIVDAVRGGLPIDRINRVTLPDDASVQADHLSPLHTRYFVSSNRDFLLRLFQFDFPGWEVRVDGRPVETELGRPEGFIVIPLDQGDHVVDVEFRDTLVRKIAWILSALSAALTLGAAFRLKTVRSGATARDNISAIERRSAACAAGLAVALLTLFVLLLNPLGILHVTSSGFRALPAQHDAFVDFGGQVALIGYDLSDHGLEPGEAVEITGYWKAQDRLNINYQVFVHLIGPEGSLVAQSDKLNPGDFPTKSWSTVTYVRDRHRIDTPGDLPPGDYRLSIGLWVAEEGWRLPVLNETGVQISDNYLIPARLPIGG